MNDYQEITHEHILGVVCDFYGLTPTQLFSSTRQYHISFPRHVFFALMRTYTPIPFQTLAEIPIYYGRVKPFNHTTLLYACSKVLGYKDVDKTFRSEWDFMNNKIKDMLIPIKFNKIVPNTVNLLHAAQINTEKARIEWGM